MFYYFLIFGLIGGVSMTLASKVGAFFALVIRASLTLVSKLGAFCALVIRASLTLEPKVGAFFALVIRASLGFFVLSQKTGLVCGGFAGTVAMLFCPTGDPA